jgi:thioredoxin 2
MTTTATSSRHFTLRCQFCDAWNRVDAARAADRPKCGKCGKPMLLDRPVKLSDETFDRTIADSEIPVMVDVYADWCGPCKIIAPAIDEIARKYQGRVLVTKLDGDQARRTVAATGVRGYPTVLLFDAGKEAGRQVGVPQGGSVGQMLDQMLAKVLGTRT